MRCGQAGTRPQGGGVRLVENTLAVDRRQHGDAQPRQPEDLSSGTPGAATRDQQRPLGRGDSHGNTLDRRPAGTDRPRECAGTARTPEPLPLEDVDGDLEVHRPGAAGRELLEDRGDRLRDLVRALDPDAPGRHGIEGRLLVLHLVQPAHVGADPAARRSR
jgi:hypothetical protein